MGDRQSGVTSDGPATDPAETLDIAADLSFCVDLVGGKRWIWLSREFQASLDLPARVYEVDHLAALVHLDAHSLAEAWFLEVLAGETHTVEVRSLREGKKSGWIRARGRRVANGEQGADLVLGTAWDTTEEKRRSASPKPSSRSPVTGTPAWLRSP